jgi:hypothetical protein
MRLKTWVPLCSVFNIGFEGNNGVGIQVDSGIEIQFKF